MTIHIPVQSVNIIPTVSKIDDLKELKYHWDKEQKLLDEQHEKTIEVKKNYQKLKTKQYLVAVKESTKKSINIWIDWIFGNVYKILHKLNKI